jgi:hypothetical protein
MADSLLIVMVGLESHILAKNVIRIKLTARHSDNRLHIDSEFKF